MVPDHIKEAVRIHLEHLKRNRSHALEMIQSAKEVMERNLLLRDSLNKQIEDCKNWLKEEDASRIAG